MNGATCAVWVAGCLAGRAAGAAASAGANAVGGTIADAWATEVRNAAAWLLRNSLGWWLQIDAVDLDRRPVHELQSYTLPLVALVAVFGTVLAGVRMIVSRKPDPLVGVGRGLTALVLASSLGTALAAAAMRGGDSFSRWVLDAASSGRAADKLVSLAQLDGVNSAVAAIILGALMFLAGLVQAALMVFREISIVVLVAVIPLAASGQFTAATRKWLPKVVGWLAALIVYKPAAALVYAAALTMWGQAKDARASLSGVVLLVMATFTLPALLKLFTWTAEAVDQRSGGGWGTASTVASSGAQVSLAMRRGGGGHQGAARDVQTSLGPVTRSPAGAPGAATALRSAPAAAGPAAAGGTAATGTAGAAAASGPAAPVVLVGAAAAKAAKTGARAATKTAADATTTGGTR